VGETREAWWDADRNPRNLVVKEFSRQTGLVLWENRGLLRIVCEFTLSSIRNDFFVGTTLF
jgi:hypothetical protein